jgi:voltage-gated potassium channel
MFMKAPLHQDTGTDNDRMGTPESDKAQAARNERFELLHHVSTLLEPAMVALGLVFLSLLLMDFASVPLMILGEERLDEVLQLIWAIFLGDFVLRLVIAPDKVAFLKNNWLGALSLALPFLRPLRVFRVARAVRGISLVRLLGGLNRGMRELRRITRGRQFTFIGALTLVVVLAGAAGSRYFDRGYPDSPVRTLGDALWWSSALVTTMDSELYVVSTEARIISFLQRLYALSIFGYITASIATYLIGVDANAIEERVKQPALQDEIRGLRQELADVRKALEAMTRENRAEGSARDEAG